jgi:phospholipid transport system substrate-binding protein
MAIFTQGWNFLRLTAIVMAACALLLPATPARAQAQAASKYVEVLASEALAVISNPKFGKEQKLGRLERIFAENVDIPWVARFVMGIYWRQASDAQKSRYVREYQKFLIKHYTARFADYSSGRFTIVDSRDNGGDEYTVTMHIMSSENGDRPILVDYRVRKDKGGFKIFDVSVEGVSMITTQRSEFTSVLGSKGIDYLIDKLGTMSAPDLAAK